MAATAGLCLFSAAPAASLELFGICIFGSCEERDAGDGLIDPRSYGVTTIVSVAGAPDSDLENAVRSASALWAGRDRPAAGSAGLLSRAKGDYRRILAALYNDARYAGEISIAWQGREIADLPAGFELPDGAQFAITVDAGKRYLFGTAEIVNAAPPPRTRDDRVPLPGDEGFSAGEAAHAAIVRQAGRHAVDAWRQQGHAKAEIGSQTVTARHGAGELDAVLTVDPGRRAHYGPVEVRGTERMNASFVARQTGIVAGQEYDPDDLRRADDRIQRLGVFRAASLKEAMRISRDGSLPLVLTVQERKLRRIGAGGTFSTVDGAGLEAFWMHRNLFGRAERLRVDARVSGIGTTTDFNRYDYFLGSTLTLPGRFTPDTDIKLSVSGEREVLELYTRNSVGGSATIEHLYSDELTFRASVFANAGEYDDVFGTRRFGVAGAGLGATFDTRNDRLDATEGVFIDVAARGLREWEFGNTIGKVEGEARAYLALGAEERTVLAGRVKIGSISGAPINRVPTDELFLAGGGSSVRGYHYRSIGVAVPGGIAGGRSIFEGSVEVRQKFSRSIGAVAFVDAGQVNAAQTPDFSGTVRIGTGLGLRYDTGLGPIRLDFAVPLNRQAGDPRYAIYAGIGQAF